MRPRLTHTHTFVKLEVSALAYDEIRLKLEDAGYDHVFIDDAIDMSGIGLVRGPDFEDAVRIYRPGEGQDTVSGPVPENNGAGENGGLLVTNGPAKPWPVDPRLAAAALLAGCSSDSLATAMRDIGLLLMAGALMYVVIYGIAWAVDTLLPDGKPRDDDADEVES